MGFCGEMKEAKAKGADTAALVASIKGKLNVAAGKEAPSTLSALSCARTLTVADPLAAHALCFFS